MRSFQPRGQYRLMLSRIPRTCIEDPTQQRGQLNLVQLGRSAKWATASRTSSSRMTSARPLSALPPRSATRAACRVGEPLAYPPGHLGGR